MTQDFGIRTTLDEVYARALDARDPRFDGVFFVGITSTGIYCRPICPARVSYPERRRFFPSAAAAERAGYRPCLRCRPELAPGRAVCDAVSRLARDAASRIAAGALNGLGVAGLARELGVSERHLRRVLEREMGVSPLELALTQRLLLAKRLLADTRLSVTRIAYASGFQSLRRFNAAFRERYRLSPSELRRPDARATRGRDDDFVRLTLAYRPPLAWSTLLQQLQRDAVRGIDAVEGDRYMSVIRVGDHVGAIAARDAASRARADGAARHYVEVDVTPSLLPVLMPVLARVRQLFDLDAEPTVIDSHLAGSGLGRLVAAHPGVRVPGALDGFDVALRVLLRRASRTQTVYESLAWRVAAALGDSVDVGLPCLRHLPPAPRRVASSAEALTSLGVRDGDASLIVDLARAVVAGRLRLEPGIDPHDLSRELRAIGIDDASVAQILARAAAWPDSFSAHDLAASSVERRALAQRAERWRPWRAYAAMHSRLGVASVDREAGSRAG